MHSERSAKIRTTAAVCGALLAPWVSLAQSRDGDELRALLTPPPVAADVELPEARRVPAEQRVAAYRDSSWKAPKTSWGHPSLEGTWSTDDVRGIPFDRPAALGTQESLSEPQFLERARMQQRGHDLATNEETFLRNEWGTRTFGFSSLVVELSRGPRLIEMRALCRRRGSLRHRRRRMKLPAHDAEPCPDELEFNSTTGRHARGRRRIAIGRRAVGCECRSFDARDCARWLSIPKIARRNRRHFL
jgi:hypothetical protein